MILVLCAAAATSLLNADTTIAANMTLTADADWRADGVVTVPQGVTVDLNGHTLWVSGLAGAGTFTSSVADPSTFDLTTKQTDATRVKSYTGGTDQALGTGFAFTLQPAWKLFGDFASYSSTQRAITDFVNGTSDPVDIVYEFDSATAVNSYKIQVTDANSYLKRSPRSWKFFGSVSGADDTWVELASQTNVTDWTRNELRQFTFFNDTAYKFYRLRFSQANGGDSVLEFFKLEYGRVQNQVRLDMSLVDGFVAASNTVSGTAKFVIAGGAQSVNADLGGLGKVLIEQDELIDLAGHNLKVHAIDGAGKVKTSNTSSFTDLTSSAEAFTRATVTTNGVTYKMAGAVEGTSDGSKYPPENAFDNNTTSFIRISSRLAHRFAARQPHRSWRR